ncbi:Hsp20/alpha crystallin family protein [Halovivax sp.]|uniref:Hsp20/alpha crystallin family protein n=1 Tax=Halovivax sp. TaxID=1935978 RepID=UPI0025B7F22A|nr:Hsp20/alpha crystallin family protein [Halovivax sp.]
MAALRDALRELPDDVFFDLLESDDAYLLVLDVPGASAASIDVTVENGRLCVEARREETFPDDFEYVEENRTVNRELSLTMPDDVTGEAVETAVERGVVEVRLPKDGATTIDVVEDESA